MPKCYLPEHATIDEACDWLTEQTDETWVLARLLECHLQPSVWFDYKPGDEAIFGDRLEGFLAPMIFNGDVQRLKTDRTSGLLTMTRLPDGRILRIHVPFPLTELKFEREAIARVAEIINASKQTDTQTKAEPTPWHLLATPTDLIKVFGTMTGMNKSWFNNAKDAPKLQAALHTAGIGGRKSREPLYYVFPVMQWLIDEKRRKGKSMEEATGWRLLKNQFPRVYEQYASYEAESD